MENPESGEPTESGDTENEFSNGQTIPKTEAIGEAGGPQQTPENEIQPQVEEGEPTKESAEAPVEETEQGENTEDSLPPSDAEIHELENNLDAAKEQLGKDLEALNVVMTELGKNPDGASVDSLAMASEAAALEKRFLNAPNEIGEVLETRQDMMEAKDFSRELEEAVENLNEAREKALDEWVEECIEHADSGIWKTMMDKSENGKEAKALIAVKIKQYLKEAGKDFVRGEADTLPGWSGWMHWQNVDTKEGKKSYITKITIGPYNESLANVPTEDEESKKPVDDLLAA